MATRKKKQQEEELLVDIVEVRDHAQSFYEQNQKLIVGIMVAVLVIAAAAVAYVNFYKIPRQNEAVDQMAQAQRQFERDSFALALTNPGGGYLGFLDIIDTYGGTKAANLAHYYSGVSYLQLGRYDAAISYLKDFNASGDIMPIMKNGALGDAYAESNDFATALSYYKKAVATDNELLTPYYLKKLGMLEEKQGDKAAALKAYQKIESDFPTSQQAQDIDKYIARVQ